MRTIELSRIEMLDGGGTRGGSITVPVDGILYLTAHVSIVCGRQVEGTRLTFRGGDDDVVVSESLDHVKDLISARPAPVVDGGEGVRCDLCGNSGRFDTGLGWGYKCPECANSTTPEPGSEPGSEPMGSRGSDDICDDRAAWLIGKSIKEVACYSDSAKMRILYMAARGIDIYRHRLAASTTGESPTAEPSMVCTMCGADAPDVGIDEVAPGWDFSGLPICPECSGSSITGKANP